MPENLDATLTAQERADVARRYVDLAVAVVSLDERIKNLAAAVDRVEEVLAATVRALDRIYGENADVAAERPWRRTN
jgi:hypothetical protein